MHEKVMHCSDLRVELVSLPEDDDVFDCSEMKDKAAYISLWDWCMPKIRDMFFMLKTTGEFSEELLKCEVPEVHGILGAGVKIEKKSDGIPTISFSLYFSDTDPQPVGMAITADGWVKSLFIGEAYTRAHFIADMCMAINGMRRFRENYEEVLARFNSVVSKNRAPIYPSDGSVSTLNSYFHREFFQKGRKFNEVVIDMRTKGTADAVLDVLTTALSGTVWED